jgi:lichenan operon transcriptional antiterminator
MQTIQMSIKLLELTMQKENITSDELLKYLCVSSRTLKGMLASINERMVDVAHISVENNLYNLHINDYSEFKQILLKPIVEKSDYNSSQKRIAYIFRKLIEIDDYVQIDDLAEEVMVSRGTIINDLKKAKSILLCYDLKLNSHSGKGKGLQLVGSEIEKRVLIINSVFDYFYEYYEMLPSIKVCVDEITSEYHLNVLYATLFSRNVSVTLKRICNGAYVAKIPYYINNGGFDSRFSKLFSVIESAYNLSLSSYEKEFLAFPVNVRSFELIETELNNKNEFEIKRIFDVMIGKIHECLCIEIDEELLFGRMKFHLISLMNRLIFHVKSFDLYLEEEMNKYPLSFHLAQLCGEVLEELLNRKMPKSEISSLAVYFELCIMNKKNIMKKIAIIGHNGRGTTLLIRKKIRDTFGPEISIVELTEQEYLESSLNEYPVVVTTVPIETKDTTIVIKVSNLFDDDFSTKNCIEYAKLEALNLNDVLAEFKVLNSKIKYRAIINKMTEDMIKQGSFSSDFTKNLKERSKKAPMVFEHLVAFPHAVMKNDKLSLSIGVLEEPIAEKNQKVQLIFLLGIPEKLNVENEKALILIYEMICKIADNSSYRSKVISFKTKKQFRDFVYEEGLV